MKLAGRIASTLGGVGSGVVLVTTAVIASRYIRRQGLEVHSVVPILPPVVAIVAILVVVRMRLPTTSIRRGAFVGLASGATLYVALSAVYLLGQYELISRDGTAWWGLMFVPAVWVWPPVVLGSTVLGALVQFVTTSVRKPRGSDA